MSIEVINTYITEAYDRLLDNCRFHCQQQHLYGLEHDLLNHVLISVLERIEKQEDYKERVFRMLESKKGEWTELDYHILV